MKARVDELAGTIYDDVWRRYLLEQDSYDAETRHGIDTAAQALWISRIAALLASGPELANRSRND